MHKTILLLLIGVAVVSAKFACPKNYCDNVKCNAVSCSSNQKYKEHGTFCGCCPACINIIKKGGSCLPLLLFGDEPAQIACDDGLKCDSNTFTCQ
ncbi:hypothetical protein HNY73_013117 [Argiope bruennichi]|uniref:Uncharacterized protein n=1 Tax=Argiope bruennichi TaxID=94029 RepID=A0A8T0EX18_ARGBR|nr:hypothetical protein HNY73_013117 [Argiope bruennichi]